MRVHRSHEQKCAIRLALHLGKTNVCPFKSIVTYSILPTHVNETNGMICDLLLVCFFPTDVAPTMLLDNRRKQLALDY